jgi:hypothetical protein
MFERGSLISLVLFEGCRMRRRVLYAHNGFLLAVHAEDRRFYSIQRAVTIRARSSRCCLMQSVSEVDTLEPRAS